ncbi:hypothetical protein G7Y89_g2959 [Cudoniella acicularis]|uniref:Uncharacterized protein n=1 Tax=Cudoniella acicularis TaxID=354080 RepID=A0A8H4W6G1_9HELO|nr:hypothetical protein G7Y89_g2959 [Cudoniella acicularis]
MDSTSEQKMNEVQEKSNSLPKEIESALVEEAQGPSNTSPSLEVPIKNSSSPKLPSTKLRQSRYGEGGTWETGPNIRICGTGMIIYNNRANVKNKVDKDVPHPPSRSRFGEWLHDTRDNIADIFNLNRSQNRRDHSVSEARTNNLTNTVVKPPNFQECIIYQPFHNSEENFSWRENQNYLSDTGETLKEAYRNENISSETGQLTRGNAIRPSTSDEARAFGTVPLKPRRARAIRRQTGDDRSGGS